MNPSTTDFICRLGKLPQSQDRFHTFEFQFNLSPDSIELEDFARHHRFIRNRGPNEDIASCKQHIFRYDLLLFSRLLFQFFAYESCRYAASLYCDQTATNPFVAMMDPSD